MSKFTNRLQEIINYHSLTASSFARSIDVQRSSISHLLSGRNKPSLDFVMKVLNTYKDVDLNWFIKGEGSFPTNTTVLQYPRDLFEDNNDKLDNNVILKTTPLNNEEGQEKETAIDKIIIFYKNGTFKKYIEL